MKPQFLFAVSLIVAGLTATSLLTAAQTAAPPGQESLQERMDALDSRMKAAEEKSDRMALEEGYVERIQKQYQKALNTQIIMVTIIGLIVAAVGKFGVDHIVESKLTEASANLREEFTKKLAEELQKLRDSNAAQIKELETTLTKRIGEAGADLKSKSDFQFQCAQALAAAADGRYGSSRRQFRDALATYKSGRHRQLMNSEDGRVLVSNIFETFHREDPVHFAEKAKGELADELYNDLADELARASIRIPWLLPLVKERKNAPHTPSKS